MDIGLASAAQRHRVSQGRNLKSRAGRFQCSASNFRIPKVMLPPDMDNHATASTLNADNHQMSCCQSGHDFQ